MQIRSVSPDYSVAEQIRISDLGIAAAQGIKTIINNRPDNEGQGQPKSADIAAAAEALGLEYFYIPIQLGTISEENIDDFERAYSSAVGPVLAFCRSGTRSVSVWALAEAKTREVDAVLAAALTAGYDLSGMRDWLTARSERPVNTQ